MNNDYYDEAISFENLYKGMKRSCRNVRWKDSVVGYEHRGILNTYLLRKDLLNGTYRIQKYEKFKIREPKEREIMATRIRDRQFQRSLCDNGLYQDIVEHFIRDNAACQKGRGTDDTLDRMKVHLRRFWNKHGKNGWVLKCDIHHFFQETSHDVAKKAIDKYVSDQKAKEAVYDIIDSFGGEKGIGLGSQISQLIELLVLSDLDHYIKERLHIKYYVRYADDFVLMHESKEHLLMCWDEIEKWLSERGLTLNKKTSLFPVKQGIVFLQWHFRYTDTGKILMLIDKNKITKQKRRIRKMLKMEFEGILPTGTAKTSLESWIANAKRGNTHKIQAEMMRYFREQELKMANENFHRKRIEEFLIANAEEQRNTNNIVFVSLAENGTIDDVTASEHAELFSDWEIGISYSIGNIRKHGENLYRCLQAHTSQQGWEPDVAVSLWKKIGDPTVEYPEWSQPVGASDAYQTGDKVSHADKHWVSTANNNVWEPGVYGWSEVS